MESELIYIIRVDGSVITVPKTVVLDFLSKVSKDSVLKRVMTLEEYHLSSDLVYDEAEGYFDYSQIHEKRKIANTYGDTYLVYFRTFDPKNVPCDIQDKYDSFHEKNPDVCMEYFLIYHYDKTDFTVDQETYDSKIIKNLKNALMRLRIPVMRPAVQPPIISFEPLNQEERPSTPPAEPHVSREYIPSKPLAEMDDAEIDELFSKPPWMRNRTNNQG